MIKTIKERQTNTSGNLSTRIVKADQVRIYVQQVGASAGLSLIHISEPTRRS